MADVWEEGNEIVIPGQKLKEHKIKIINHILASYQLR